MGAARPVKHDGFRALVIVEGHRCTLISRRGHVLKRWPQLAEELAHTVKARHAVLDGNVVCLRPDGRSDFHALLFRSEWPYFFAFDVLSIDGRDLRAESLLTRKRELRRLMPRHESRLRYVDHIRERGRDLFDLAFVHDTEGVLAKWSRRSYCTDCATTSWLKFKSPDLCRPAVYADRSRSILVHRAGLGAACWHSRAPVTAAWAEAHESLPAWIRSSAPRRRLRA